MYYCLTYYRLTFFTLLLHGSAFAAKNCRTEILVNDPNALISINGNIIKADHYFVECKNTPQNILIVAPDKKPFIRVMPAESDFDVSENFWNIQLQRYAEERAVNPIYAQQSKSIQKLKKDLEVPIATPLKNPDASAAQPFAVKKLETAVAMPLVTGAAKKSANLKTMRSVAKPFDTKPVANVIPEKNKNSFVHHIKKTVQIEKTESVEENVTTEEEMQSTRVIRRALSSTSSSSPFAENFNDPRASSLPGLFVQIKSIAELRASKQQVQNRLTSIKEKLAGVPIVLCPKKKQKNEESTLVLFGPLDSAEEGYALSKRLGQQMLFVRNPICEVGLKLTLLFQKQKGS